MKMLTHSITRFLTYTLTHTNAENHLAQGRVADMAVALGKPERVLET